MTDPNNLPTPPWWSSRETRHAARDEARRQRRQAKEAHRGAEEPVPAREPVTPERIADAALRLIDVQGLDGLTVRALAQELGVGTMTLYWYVQNKDEVLDLVADRMLADIPLPPADMAWQAAVRQVAVAVRAALLRHGGAVPVMLGRGSFGPNGLRIVDNAIRVFRAAGFEEADAADSYFAVANFVNGFAAQQTAGSFLASRPGFDGKGYFRMVQAYIEALPVDRYPNLQAAAPRIFSASLDERFAFGLDCLIGGLEARLTASREAGDSAAS
jgi:TetR/AcrR family transcriptional regulator, tetracycline repressor protein